MLVSAGWTPATRPALPQWASSRSILGSGPCLSWSWGCLELALNTRGSGDSQRFGPSFYTERGAPLPLPLPTISAAGVAPSRVLTCFSSSGWLRLGPALRLKTFTGSFPFSWYRSLILVALPCLGTVVFFLQVSSAGGLFPGNCSVIQQWKPLHLLSTLFFLANSISTSCIGYVTMLMFWILFLVLFWQKHIGKQEWGSSL